MPLERVVRIRTGETDDLAVTPVGRHDGQPRLFVAQAAKVDTGDTAWMLAATALVLLMTPALGLFYAGLVRAKNTLNTFMMCIARDRDRRRHVGARRLLARVRRHRRPDRRAQLRARMHDVTFEPRDGTTIPHLVFFAFQATFCIITTALVSGAVVERMRFGAFMVFAALWSVLVYSVMAHWAFGGGWLIEGGTLDFAGGVPVEMGSGFSALAAALVVGARKDYGRQALLPHNAVFVLLGAGLLWFGWFGFNGGSGFSTGNPSVLAFTNTLLTPACTLLAWFALDLIRGRTVTAIGAATAIIVGCVGITPAGGFVSPGYAMALGFLVALPTLRRDRLAAADPRGRDARRARRARRRGLHRHPLHRVLRPGVVERRLGRPRLRQRRPARRPGAGRARCSAVRVRGDVRAAAR